MVCLHDAREEEKRGKFPMVNKNTSANPKKGKK